MIAAYCVNPLRTAIVRSQLASVYAIEIQAYSLVCLYPYQFNFTLFMLLFDLTFHNHRSFPHSRRSVTIVFSVSNEAAESVGMDNACNLRWTEVLKK